MPAPLSDFYTHLDELLLARIQFIIRTTRGACPLVDDRGAGTTARRGRPQLVGPGRGSRRAAFGEAAARARLRRLTAFPIGYQARTDAGQAIADLRRIEAVLAGSPLEASLHPREDGELTRAAALPANEPVVLSDMLPILENLGLRVIAEEPFRIDSATARGLDPRIHPRGAPLPRTVAAAVSARFEEALVAVWTGSIENDGFNRLVLAAGLSARQTTILRLYAKVLRQAGIAFSQAYMEDTLAAIPISPAASCSCSRSASIRPAPAILRSR